MKRILIATAAFALLALGWAALAEGTGPAATTPAAQAFTLGTLKLFALSDSRFVAANDGKTFGVDAGPAAVAKVLASAGLPTDRITVAVDALVVIAPGHVILFDTGLGPRAHASLPASLALAGVAPGDVTDVLITHTHGDHIGGLLTAAGGSAFPKAAIRMSAKEWAWISTEESGTALVKAIGGQVKTFEPGAPILPGVTPIAIAGHTPGHVGYEISSGGARLLDIGDTAHSSLISLAKPAWAMGFDNDVVLGRQSREATLAELAANQELVFAPHFPFPGVGRVEKAGDGYAWKPGLK